MDRRPGRLGASGCRCACSAGAAGHTPFNRDAQHAHHLVPSHHDTAGSVNDHDAADADHDEAGCHVRGVLGP
jgi:hypothetical protein